MKIHIDRVLHMKSGDKHAAAFLRLVYNLRSGVITVLHTVQQKRFSNADICLFLARWLMDIRYVNEWTCFTEGYFDQLDSIAERTNGRPGIQLRRKNRHSKLVYRSFFQSNYRNLSTIMVYCVCYRNMNSIWTDMAYPKFSTDTSKAFKRYFARWQKTLWGHEAGEVFPQNRLFDVQ